MGEVGKERGRGMERGERGRGRKKAKRQRQGEEGGRGEWGKGGGGIRGTCASSILLCWFSPVHGGSVHFSLALSQAVEQLGL